MLVATLLAFDARFKSARLLSLRRSFALFSIMLLGIVLLPLVSSSAWGAPSDWYTEQLSSGVRSALQQSLGSSVLQTLSSTDPTDAQVTFDPDRLPQNEPSISINPVDQSNLVVGGNDYRLLAFGGFPWVGAYASFDRGLTWPIQQLIPGYPGDSTTTVLTGFDAAADPSVVFDGNGNVYYGGLAFKIRGNRPVDGSVFVSKSINGGVSFAQTALVTRGSRTVFNDKPYITVDNSGSEFDGRVYVSWTRFSADAADIMVSYSDDGGVAFSDPLRVSSSSLNQGSLPVVGPSGEVYVVWNDLFNNRIMLASSLDAGVAFSNPVQIARYVPLPEHFPNSRFRVNNNPAAAVDNTTSYVYVSWSDYGAGNADVLFSRSTDGGTGWSTPRRVDDDTSNSDQFFSWMTVSSGRLSMVFYDRRVDPQNHLTDVFYTESVDGGSSFSPNMRVTDVSSNPDAVIFSSGESFIGDYIGIATAEESGHPVWTDLRNVAPPASGNQDIFTDTILFPAFDSLEPVNVDEETQLTVIMSARDPNVPPDTVSLACTDCNTIGATFNTATGEFSWKPTESQGPAAYSVLFTAFNGFLTGMGRLTINVNEVNTPPSLSIPDFQTVQEGTMLSFTVTAIDFDIPENIITLSCDICTDLGADFIGDPGVGTAMGTFAWTPAEDQAPKAWTVGFTAVDDGFPETLDSKSRVIDVKEVNSAPVLIIDGPQTVDESANLEVTVTVVDYDLDALGEPLDTLILAVSVLPEGAAFPVVAGRSPIEGTFSWTPGETQDGKFSFTFTVLDSGSPVLFEFKEVEIEVIEVDQPPELVVPGPQTVVLGATLTFGVSLRDPDIPPNTIELSCDICFQIGADFDPETGIFYWVPPSDQGPGVYTLTITAAELDGELLSDEKTITITVKESGELTSPFLPFLAGLGPIQRLALVLVSALALSTVLRFWWVKKRSRRS